MKTNDRFGLADLRLDVNVFEHLLLERKAAEHDRLQLDVPIIRWSA